MRVHAVHAGLAAGAVVVLVLAAITILAPWGRGLANDLALDAAPPQAIPLAVLGDSNSHSYQDRITFPPGTPERGGARRAQTFQWTEVLARLRGNELDLGPWVDWGRPGVVAWAREMIGLAPDRSPRKEDYLYNFANSGAACKNLMGDRLGQRYRQAPRLVALMDRAPARWRRGVVVINIGANDWNGLLDLQARDPDAPRLHAVIDYCVQQIGDAIALIHATHPQTRILLTGLGNEADDPNNFGKYRSHAEMANIEKALADFNEALKKIVARNPRTVAYMDYAAWFAAHWGTRGPNGEPDYRSVRIGALQVGNTLGDGVENALLSDDHAGTAWNALWAQAVVARLRQAFDLPLTPISDEEVARFVGG